MEWRSRRRKQYVLDTAAYAITEGLEEAELIGLLTRGDVQYLYSHIGHRTHLFGLLPRRLEVQPDLLSLKEEIQGRLRGLYERRIHGMHRNSIVWVQSGKLIPTDIRKKLCASTKAIGLAVVDTVNKVVDIDMQFTEKFLENVDMAEDSFKDLDRVYSFQNNSEGDIHPDDLQPFVVLEKNYKKGDDTYKAGGIVAFMDGGFIGAHQAASVHSNAFFTFNKAIKEEATSLLEDAKGDENALLEEMLGTRFGRYVQNLCVPNGAVLFMAGWGGESGRGKIWAIEYNQKTSKKLDWGWMSSDLSDIDAEGKNITPTHIHPEGGSTMTPAEIFKSRMKGGTTPSTDIKEAVRPPPTDTAAARQVSTIDQNHIVKPPDQVMKRSMNKIKRWYRFHFGKSRGLPKDLSAGLPYHMLLSTSPLRAAHDAESLRKALNNAKDMGDDIDDDDEDDKTPVQSVPNAGTKLSGIKVGPIMLVSPKNKETFAAELVKLTLRDPNTFIKDAADETADFNTQTGFKFEEMILLDDTSLLEFARIGNGELAAIALRDAYSMILRKYDTEFLAMIVEEYNKNQKKADSNADPFAGLSPAERFKAERAAKAKAG